MGNTNQVYSGNSNNSLKDDEDELNAYDRKIRLLMGNDDDDFHQEFTGILESIKSKEEMIESAAIVKLTGMMKDKFDDLVLGLNCHLSDGFKIEKSDDGNLCYRSPAQEDSIPLLVDNRVQQTMAELNEAKLKLKLNRDRQKQQQNVKNVGTSSPSRNTRSNTKVKLENGVTKNEHEIMCTDTEEGSNRKLLFVRQKVELINTVTKCAICLEPMKDTHVSPDCLHRFCGECFKESIWHDTRCPICRKHISSKRSLRKDEGHDTLVQAFHDITNIISDEDHDDGDKILTANHSSTQQAAAETRSNKKLRCRSEAAVVEDHLHVNNVESSDVIQHVNRNRNRNRNNAVTSDAIQQRSNKKLRCRGEAVRVKQEHGHDAESSDVNQHGSSNGNMKNEVTVTSDMVQHINRNGNSFNKLHMRYWNDKIDQLEKFKAEHGHLDINRRNASKSLSDWCSSVRRSYRDPRAIGGLVLTDDRMETLKRVGFDFVGHDAKSTPPGRTTSRAITTNVIATPHMNTDDDSEMSSEESVARGLRRNNKRPSTQIFQGIRRWKRLKG